MEHLTLTEVKIRFIKWRTNKKHREPIPGELWDSAVLLTEKHSIHKVSKTLGLSYATLKKRVSEAQTSPSAPAPVTPEFISVGLGFVVQAECCIEMEQHNSNKLRMHFKGKAELDLQSIAESFWSRN